MRTQPVAVPSVLQTPEDRTRSSQASEALNSSHLPIAFHVQRKSWTWLMASRLCLIVAVSALPISLVNCSGGGSGSSGSTGGTGLTGGGGSTTSAPTISSITPQNATAGSGGLTVTVSGSGFVSASTVDWNGSALATTASGAQLTATVPAADVATAGLAQITVVNPSTSGGTSKSAGFIINGTPGFLYVANMNYNLPAGSISGFSIDPATGSLTPVPGSPFPAGPMPSSIAADPTGKYLYETNNLNGALTNPIFAFAIDSSTGALTPIPGSPFASGANTTSVSIDPTGKFLYTADSGGTTQFPAAPATISEFSIDATTGALTAIGQAACGSAATHYSLANYLVTDPAARLVFAATSDPSICSFSMDSSGVLQQSPKSPFAYPPSGVNPRSATMDPFGTFLYAANFGTGAGTNISAFSIAADTGMPTQLSASPFSVETTAGASALVADPLGRFLWVDDMESGLSAFKINQSTGDLSMLAGFPWSSVQLSLSSLGSLEIAPDPSGKFLYLLTQTGDSSGTSFAVSGYAIDPTSGALTPIPGSPYALPGTNSSDGPVTLIVTNKTQ
jgi:6-phosphogluconolactonase (cycloisomerase 2 family)